MQLPGRLLTFLWAVTACLGVAVVAHAQAGKEPQGDASAVRAASKEFLAAARRGDEGALRKLWSPEGDFVDAAGRVSKAGDVIHQLAASPSSPTAPVVESASVTTVRFITPDTAIEDGIADRATSADGSPLNRRFTALWVKRDGKWLLDSLREVAAEPSSLNENLKPLSWLLGEWAATTDNTAILVSSHWNDEGNYILREFVVAHEDGETVTGTQRIGWDPIARQIKSWTFDSEGGSGEERWRHEGNRWFVDTIDVTADGKQGKTSCVYIPGDARRFTWEVAGADVGGVALKPTRVEFRQAKEDE